MSVRNGTLAFLFVALIFTGLSGQTTVQENKPPSVERLKRTESMSQPVLQSRGQRYRLGRGDVFDLDFAFTPEFNETATVQPDGYIPLHDLGDVKVLGLTIPEASETIRNAYVGVLSNPKIAIILKDFEKPYFIAGGWVQKPGKYDLRGDITLAQAIQVAGGLRDGAKTSQVLMFRTVSPDLVQVKKINLKDILSGKEVGEDIDLQPGDMFFVPESTYNKIAPYIPRAALATYFDPSTF